jgi:uncharacterized protein (DUF885 family)
MLEAMTFRRSSLAFSLFAVFMIGPASGDVGSDLNGLINGYLNAGQRLRPTTEARVGQNLQRYDETLTAAYMADRRKLNEGTRTRLLALDRQALKPQDQVTYDIFRWELEDEADELAPGVAERFQLLPMNQFDGLHITFPREMQWRPGGGGYARAQDYDGAIRRLLDFTRRVDRAIANMREGIRQGVVQPRAIVETMIAQTEMFADPDVEKSLFFEPAKHLPAAIAGTERARITAAYREAVAGEVIPAYRRLADFLKDEYLPKSRETIGLSAMPGGKEMYLHLVRSETTENLSPEEIHALGMSELARIEHEMEETKTAAHFPGTLAQFRDFLRTDPRFKFKDEAAMAAEFNRVKGVVESHLDQVFSGKPQAGLVFRFYESYLAPNKPAAEYTPGSQDGKRPGTVYLNSFDLPSRPTYTSEVLELHEGIPGHHLQIDFARSNRILSRFRRFESQTAYVEGWGLYAETLGPELGVYSDPYQKFGALTFDAWRASRLVVDTGIHWLGWSREQSVAFLLAHTTLSQAEAAEEVDRYIAIPAQALGYKIGEKEILDLRAKAKVALGEKFDLKKFHDAILKDGAMPLAILHAKVERWIDGQKES